MGAVREKVADIVDSIPEGASVTLPRRVLADWLDADADACENGGHGDERAVADLTVEDIAQAHGKAESTVRGWLQEVPGAYRLGNELRVPREAWRAYLDSLSDGDDGPAKVRSKRTADLGSWRNGGGDES